MAGEDGATETAADGEREEGEYEYDEAEIDRTNSTTPPLRIMIGAYEDVDSKSGTESSRDTDTDPMQHNATHCNLECNTDDEIEFEAFKIRKQKELSLTDTNTNADTEDHLNPGMGVRATFS